MLSSEVNFKKAWDESQSIDRNWIRKHSKVDEGFLFHSP